MARTRRKAPARPKLGPEQRREHFALAYSRDPNATQAAIAAGYSPKTADSQGQRLLKDARVLSRIAELQRPVLRKLEREVGITLERYLRENAYIALADPGKLFEEGPHGMDRLKPITTLPAAVRRSIASVKVRQTRPRGADDPFEEYVTEVKFWDKGAAIDRGIRHMGGYPREAPNIMVLLQVIANKLPTDELAKLCEADDATIIRAIQALPAA